MAEQVGRVPSGVDVNTPSPARGYDFLLGGKDNYAADRELAQKMLTVAPDTRAVARANRAFLVRAVRTLAEAGVRQFIDLGSGIPTSPNVHEVARTVHPEARVVYVDVDPIAAAHARALLATDASVTAVRADVRDPASVLADPGVTGLIDFAEPVGVLMVALLHVVAEDADPDALVAAFRAPLASGSHLVVSQFSTDSDPAAMEHASQPGPIQITFRSRERIGTWFDGMELLEPGVTDVTAWRPDGAAPAEQARRMRIAAAVGRKP
ncbi:SAM-dependent methyltransferase [Actinomadura hibisca]|uniref:SAM-dependent methyltransferase n=1 Tax=Actinomadura hibisca TaxID=68565 RepID=UPI00082DFF04|nr:SAM-dependent methyltransferase [Actinomadura hibisca]